MPADAGAMSAPSCGSLPLDQIICGDNCEVMRQLPSESIDLVVTSPPYDDLRTYGGHSWDFYGVAWNLKRLLKPGGVIVWVVADATKDGSETLTSMTHAQHFKGIGLNVWDTMIFKKSGGSPNIHHPRYVHCWEYMFVFSRGTPRSFNAVKLKRNSTAGSKVPPKRKMQRNGEIKSFNVLSTVTPEFSRELNLWEYLVGKASGDTGCGNHSAYFPESLARDHILSWSNPGDVVLDPFSGSGTTAKMARETGRRFIGIEVNPEYVEISRKRLAQQVLPMEAAS